MARSNFSLFTLCKKEILFYSRAVEGDWNSNSASVSSVSNWNIGHVKMLWLVAVLSLFLTQPLGEAWGGLSFPSYRLAGASQQASKEVGKSK